MGRNYVNKRWRGCFRCRTSTSHGQNEYQNGYYSKFDIHRYLSSIGGYRFAFAEHVAGMGVDSVEEQKKLEARKMLENAAESPASGTRFFGQPCAHQNYD
jgi:hypothetical protein